MKQRASGVALDGLAISKPCAIKKLLTGDFRAASSVDYYCPREKINI
jgi:hypothetical protein